MYLTQDIVSANAQAQNGTVSVGLVVPGPPPVSGASITAPQDGSLLQSDYVDVSGTCQPATFVVLYRSGQLVGSAICTNEGQFMTNIHLLRGGNDISAKNFDNLNQPGPSTPSITIYYIEKTQSVVLLPVVELPASPVMIPGASSSVSLCSSQAPNNSKNVILSSIVAICSNTATPVTCDDYKNTSTDLPEGGELSVSVVCTPRYGVPNKTISMGILVWGGQPPYALSVNWGDIEKDTLVSISSPGYVVVNGAYARTGNFAVGIIVSDKNNKNVRTVTTLEVSGDNKSESFIQYINNGINSSWFDTPVPLYMTALVVTLGFWGGDIFDRYLGASKSHSRKTRHA